MGISPIRIGVIGTGVMGGHHARVAALLPGCQLVGIYDRDTARAEEIARLYETNVYASQDDLCADAEAVIVATPTVTHASVATACLQAGVHVLLEKPIAATLNEAVTLAEFSRTVDRLLMIGHVERFNPAFSTLISLLNGQELFSCELHRLSTGPGRDQSADIIFDLMIHDLDLVLAIARSRVTAISAMGHRVRSGLIDHVSALLRFENGMTASLTASAVSQERVRKAKLFTSAEQFTVDFASREVWIHRHGKSSIAQEDGQYYLASQVEQILVPNREPLVVEQEHFLKCIREGVTPMTDAEAGLHALHIAFDIQQRVNEQLAEVV